MRISTSLRAATVAALLIQGATIASAQGNSQQSQYNWNGAYGGLNLGGAFGGSDLLSTIGSGLPFLEGEVYPNNPISGTANVISAFRSNELRFKSITGGAQLGYNFFSGGWLYGVEGDINALRLDKSLTTSAVGKAAAGSTLYTFRNHLEADYIATLRARFGTPFAGGLIYGTGGLALTTLKFNHSMRATGGDFNGLFEDASARQTKLGWTVGGGYELPISSSMTLKTEYLFAKFDDLSTEGHKIFPLAAVAAQGINQAPEVNCGVNTGQVPNFVTPRQCFKHKADLFLHMIRIGLNFKF